MIKTLEEKIHVNKQLNRLENALYDLRSKLLPMNEDLYRIMSSSYINKINELRREIDEFIGCTDESIKDFSDFIVRLQGPEIGYGYAPISIVTGMLDEVRKGFQNIYAYIAGYGYIKKPTKDVLRACDFNIMSVFEGSLQVALRRPNDQISFFEDNSDDPFNKTAEVYYHTANWASNYLPSDFLKLTIPDDDLRDVALKSVLKIIPKDKKRVKNISIYGNLFKEQVNLTSEVREHIVENIVKKEPNEEVVTYTGRIREIDLDKLSFKLRELRDDNGVNEITCIIEDRQLDEVRESLDEVTLVKGVIENQSRASKKIIVRYIEKVD